MIPQETISKALSDIENWLPNFVGLPYKHLGETREGIDCFNLCRLVYAEVLGIEIPYTTKDTGCTTDLNWYNTPDSAPLMINYASSTAKGWDTVSIAQPFDVLVMSIGSTNSPNHCGLYLGSKKLLQTMEGYTSWVTLYGRWYQQFTMRICRWNNNFKN